MEHVVVLHLVILSVAILIIKMITPLKYLQLFLRDSSEPERDSFMFKIIRKRYSFENFNSL